MKIKPIKLIKIKTFQPKLMDKDIDKDGVPNWKDCKPLDPRKHRISRTMKKRIQALPIVASPATLGEEQEYMFQRTEKKMTEAGEKRRDSVTERMLSMVPYMYSRPLPHIMSKEAKRTAPTARKQFLSTVKKYPSIVGQIEKIQPKKVIVASKHEPRVGIVTTGWTSPTEEVYLAPRRHKKHLAKTIYHELKHTEQTKKHTPEEFIGQYEEGEYDIEEREEIPFEKEAIEFAEEQMKGYRKGRRPTGKEITKTLQLEEEE